MMKPTETWIDVHTHLNMLEEGVEEGLRRAKEAGVSRVITIGTEPEDLPLVLDYSEKYPEQVSCTLGIHPHEGKVFDSKVEKFIEENLSHPGVVAVGEIGLDYYYNNSSREEQLHAFERQMQMAKAAGLPVEIHTRDAEADTIQILKKYAGQVTGLIHCFTGTQELADRALEYGFNLSFSGVITFKNAGPLREVVKNTPLDRLHVETDAPFLAPVPYRGKKNTSAYMLATAQWVADLKEISLAQLCQATKANAHNIFKRLPEF